MAYFQVENQNEREISSKRRCFNGIMVIWNAASKCEKKYEHSNNDTQKSPKSANFQSENLRMFEDGLGWSFSKVRKDF